MFVFKSPATRASPAIVYLRRFASRKYVLSSKRILHGGRVEKGGRVGEYTGRNNGGESCKSEGTSLQQQWRRLKPDSGAE